MTDDDSFRREQLQLDRDKLALEEKKLQWEKDRAAFENEKYEAESQKRAVDLAKVKAEAEKVELEAADLRIPFKDRPSYRAQKYQMLATAAAIISLIVSFGTIKPALDAYFAEKNAKTAEDGKQAAEKRTAAADTASKDAEAKTQHAEERLETLRTQIVPLEEQAETATAKRIQAEHDLDDAKQGIKGLIAETQRLEATRAGLEKQVGTLSRAEAYQRLQASISESSTTVTELLADRIRDSLSPDRPSDDAPAIQDILMRLQDNLNFIALARSLTQLFTAAPGSNPMTQSWKFTYSMTNVRSRVLSDDVAGTFSILTKLNLISPDKAVMLQRDLKAGEGHRYLQISGDLTIPLSDSPFFAEGHPRSEASFVKLYRENLAAYVEASQKSFRSQGTEYRVRVLKDDQLWNRIAKIGNPSIFNQVLPGMTNFEAGLVGVEYGFVMNASSNLARLSRAIDIARGAIQSGDADAYAVSLNELLAALRPFQHSPQYFDSKVPWLLLMFDDVTHRKMTLKADCEITGMPRQQLNR